MSLPQATAGPGEGPALEQRRWHYRRSLASRVAILTALAVAATLLLLSVATFLSVRMQLLHSLDESLLDRAHKAASFGTLDEITAMGLPPWMLGAADVRVVVLTTNRGNYTADGTGPGLPLGPAEFDVLTGKRDESVRTAVAVDGTRYRIAAVPSSSDQALVLAQPLKATDQTLARLSSVSLVSAGMGVLAAAIAGWGVASNGLRPVRRLTARAEHIARTEDLTPLPIEGDDEITRLALSFNHMLAALSASRDRQRQLVADAGHELRTPLTSLRTNLDLLAQAGDALEPEQRAELLGDVRSQVEELSTLVGDLVELAREEPLTHVVETVDLAAVTERAVARVRRRAPLVSFDVSLAPWTVSGEPAALERAVTNLLDNAAKWSPAGGTVEVRLFDGVLTVCDEGPGIAEEDLPHVFERFYRSTESRTMPGSGLGLAIVRQTAERHSGAVRADRAPQGGARLSLWLPGEPG